MKNNRYLTSNYDKTILGIWSGEQYELNPHYGWKIIDKVEKSKTSSKCTLFRRER